MDWIVSTTKGDFLGKRSFARADTARLDRKQLVGLLPAERLAEGAQLVSAPTSTAMLGHVTSSYDSVALGRPFALALVASGRDRIGETVYADGIAAEIVDSVLYDPEGARRDGHPA
jgi:sarcosine oxidase subunit alpha